MSDSDLEIPIDNRLVRLTRDDFLSGSRQERGRQIVGGGLIPRTNFWFVVGPNGQIATSGWVEHRRNGPPAGVYRLPTDPLVDFIEIFLPQLEPEDSQELLASLEIDNGILPEPGTDLDAIVGDVRLHLIADEEAVFLLAVSEG